MFSKIRELGHGSFSKVYLCDDEINREPIAIKRTFKYETVDGPGGSTLIEVDGLALMRKHPFAISAKTICRGPIFMPGMQSPIDRKFHPSQRDDVFSPILEVAEGDLKHYIYEVPDRDFSQIQRFMAQILLVIEFMHENHIMHRDIKTQNILHFASKQDPFGQHGFISICDFGMMKYAHPNSENSPRLMTSWFRAPEMALLCRDYDCKIDVWSIGCVFYEMIGQKYFISGIDDDDNLIVNTILGSLPYQITRETAKKMFPSDFKYSSIARPPRRLSFPDQLQLSVETIHKIETQIGPGKYHQYCDLLLKMLQFDPALRFSTSECLSHSFFDNLAPYIMAVRQNVKLSYHHHHYLNDRQMLTVPIIERKWMLEIAESIYQSSPGLRWYSSRILFTAIDIFERYLYYEFSGRGLSLSNRSRETDIHGLVLSKLDVQIFFFATIYMTIKFYTSSRGLITWKETVGPALQPDDIESRALKFESDLLSKHLMYVIYRRNLYEYYPPGTDRVPHSAQDIRNILDFLHCHDDYYGEYLSSLYYRYQNFIKRKTR